MTWHILWLIAWLLWSVMHPEFPNLIPREMVNAAIAVEQLATKANHTMDTVTYVLWALVFAFVAIGLVQVKRFFGGGS